MGRWLEEFKLQKKKFTPKMTTADAIRMVAYWAGERDLLSHEAWREVTALVVKEAPEKRRRVASKLIATDLALKLIFGSVQTRPKVTEQVRAAVLTYSENSAKLLDRTRSRETPPRFNAKQLKVKVQELLFGALGEVFRPNKKSDFPVALVLAGLFLFMKDK